MDLYSLSDREIFLVAGLANVVLWLVALPIAYASFITPITGLSFGDNMAREPGVSLAFIIMLFVLGLALFYPGLILLFCSIVGYIVRRIALALN